MPDLNKISAVNAAQDLLFKYRELVTEMVLNGGTSEPPSNMDESAKEYAILCADTIMEFEFEGSANYNFWQQVKQELEKRK